MSTWVVQLRPVQLRPDVDGSADVVEAEGPFEAIAIVAGTQLPHEIDRRTVRVAAVGEWLDADVWTDFDRSQDTWEQRWTRRLRVVPTTAPPDRGASR